MTAHVEDDEYGHSIELHGMVHRVEFFAVDKDEFVTDNVLFGITHYAPNGFNLSQEDVNALYKFLERYVTE
jgi:hypothetical protein